MIDVRQFRGKRKDNGKWTYGDLIQLLGEQGGGRKFIVDNRFGACFDQNGDFLNTEAPFVNEVDPETIGQYTGLQDKNGREIYEGDVVKGSTDIFSKMTGAVVFVGAKYIVDGVGKYKNIREDLESSYEIIGSIYENPELLEV